MKNIEKVFMVKVIVTGIQKYGVFAQTDNYEGLIHISEISYGYVKNVNDYVKIGDEIYAKVVDVDNEDNHLKLSIKDIDYKNDVSKLERMDETKNGFKPLKDNLEIWITEKKCRLKISWRTVLERVEEMCSVRSRRHFFSITTQTQH